MQVLLLFFIWIAKKEIDIRRLPDASKEGLYAYFLLGLQKLLCYNKKDKHKDNTTVLFFFYYSNKAQNK